MSAPKWPRVVAGLALVAGLAVATTLAATPAAAAAQPLPADVTALSTPALAPNGLLVAARDPNGAVLVGVRLALDPTVPPPPLVSIGGNFVGDPTLSQVPDGTLILGRGPDNQVHSTIVSGIPNGAPATFTPVPGLLVSSEITAVRIPPRFDGQLVRIFARGLADGAVYTNLLTVDGWRGWTNLGGFITSEITAALTTGPSSPFSDFRLVVRGGDNRVFTMVLFNDLTNSGWIPVGGPTITGNIAISSNGATTALRGNEIFVRDAATRAVLTYNFDNPGWVNLGGVGNSDLSVSALQDGSLEVYVRGTTLNLYVNRRPPNSTQWSGYANLGGKLTNNPVSRGFAALPASSAALADEIIVRGTDGTLFVKGQDFTIGFTGYFAFPGPKVA